MRNTLCKILVMIVLVAVTAKVSSQNLHGSFESKFKRYQKNETFNGTETLNWEETAWKGERIYKQIVLWSSVDLNNLEYEISELKNGNHSIPSASIKLLFGKYVKGDPEARSCSEYPTHPDYIEMIDALSNNYITSIKTSDPIKLWLAMDIPETSIAGTYKGTISVNGGDESLVFSLNIEVVDYVLPKVEDWSFHLDLWQFPVNILNHYNDANPNNKIAIWSDEHFALFEPAYKLLAETGQKAITTYIKGGALGAESMVKWIQKADGSWDYDFTAFDKYVNTLMSWGITKQIDCFSPVGWNENTIPYWDEVDNRKRDLDVPLGSETYNTRWDHFLSAFKIHLESKGWFDKTILFLDEVEHTKLENVFTMIRNNNTAWKIGLAHTKAISSTISEKLYDASGILGSTSTEGRDGKITTFYTSCSQVKPNSYVSPDNSLAEMVWMGWHATKENLSGYLRWAYDYWRLNDPFDARDGGHTAGDFSLVYRSSNTEPIEFLPSLRLIMLREGIQDFEKLKIIKKSLKEKQTPYNQQLLATLNNLINSFESTSGGIAEALVQQGQKAIEEIVLGTFSYCKADNEGTSTDYYVKSLTGTGGNQNLNFTTNQYPNTGYEYHTASKINVEPEESFTLNLENSAASNCARTKIWIDWNNDEDFDDAGEEVFSGGNQSSCSNNVSYSIPITVPADVAQGIKRMRIRVRESNENEPLACGSFDKTGTADFDIEILVLDEYCIAGEESFLDYYVVGLTTTGGIGDNINFTGNGFPLNGYEHHTNTKIDTETGGSFTLNLENSTTSNCARTSIWIDWNNDKDFDDSGEQIYNGDIAQSCENTISKTINVQVPPDAAIGKTRMRVRLRDAWLDEPVPCGVLKFTGSADFEVNIMSVTSNNTINISHPPKINNVYPNPLKNNYLTVNLPEIKNQKVAIHFFSVSGRLVSEYNYNSFTSPKTIYLPSGLVGKGIYLMKIMGENTIYTYKVLKL